MDWVGLQGGRCRLHAAQQRGSNSSKLKKAFAKHDGYCSVLVKSLFDLYMYDDGCDEMCVVLQATHKRLLLVNFIHKDQEERMKPARNSPTFIFTKANKAREDGRFGTSSHSYGRTPNFTPIPHRP